ncbi:hypothetical protein ABGV42_01770 [Paenibacillus pabuli]|uniref:hypothetical protein n=1 Tax=Paenibacillus pabuli TaxID=1472 RepID=UPI003242FAA0
MAEQNARLKQRKSGAGAPDAGAKSTTKSSSKTRFAQTDVDKAKREIVASIGNHFARKKGKGNTYFSNPGVIGYVIRNVETDEKKAVSRREAVNLSARQASLFKEGNSDAVLFFRNAVHEMSESDAKEKVELPDGTIQQRTQVGEDGQPIKKVSLRLRGINGLSLLNEKMVADGRAIPKNDHYTSQEYAQKAFSMYQEILEGKIPATEELLNAMKEAQTTTRTGNGGSKNASKNILDELDNFMAKAAGQLQDVELVEI